MIASSGASSLGGRLRLSVESSHSVTTSMPSSSHQPRNGEMFAAPARWPAAASAPAALRPPAVAVEHDADVLREPLGRQAAATSRAS